MPIRIPDGLPARKVLEEEDIFVMTENRAIHQDIRPLQIVILNLMPTKIETETQILRLLGNTPLQVDITLLHTDSYQPRNTSAEHLANFYQVFSGIKDNKYDGFIITGAPVENLDFTDVDYWEELCQIMEWSRHNVFSTLHICWGAQAGLYFHYGIDKKAVGDKISGIYQHTITRRSAKLLKGFDELFNAPHSRYTEVSREDIVKVKELEILAESDRAGVYIISSKDERQVFVTGHPEYDRLTLKQEYLRDVKKDLDINIPHNYFPDNNPDRDPGLNWRSHASLLYNNWLNYYVYQATPFNLKEIN